MKKTLASLVAVLALSSPAFAANYKITVTPPATVKKGQKAVALIHVEGTNGYIVNVDYPMGLKVTPPAGVQVDKPSQTKADATALKKTGADFQIAFTPSDTGKKDFTGELKMAVATDKDAAPFTEKIAFSVTVN